MRAFTNGALISLAALGIANAQSYADADEIVIRDVFATVEIELSGSGDVTIAKSGPNSDELEVSGSRVMMVAGPDEIDRRRWQKTYQRERGNRNWRTARDEDPTFDKLLEDRPTIVISAPEGTAIVVEDSAVKLTVEGTAGDTEINGNIHLLAILENIDGDADLSVHGRGYLKAGDISGSFDGSVHGSGDLIVANTGPADLSVHGSGDLDVEDISGRLSASVHGSGDLNVGAVDGDGKASVHGSGDLVIASLKGFEGSVHGSGDLNVGRIDGDVDVDIHGSGDMEVDDGEADDLRVSVRGSGEFEFGGTAKTATLSSGGSGSIDIGKVTGNTKISGKNIRIDGRKVSGDSD